MPGRVSAGVLIHRRHLGQLEVCLVHPGGPFWARKDFGAWTIPKGEIEPGEDPLAAARRECLEETGQAVDGVFVPLTPVRLRSGKTVHAWAVAADLDVTAVRSTTFLLEWPPRSGRMQAFPEVDRAAWFPLEEARRRLQPAMCPWLDQLHALVEPPTDPDAPAGVSPTE